MRKEESYLRIFQAVNNHRSLKSVGHNRQVIRTKGTLAGLEKLIIYRNQVRSIAKRLVECMPQSYWTTAVISCNQRKL